MAKALSQLQKDILAALEQWPAFKELPQGEFYDLKLWARPREIIRKLDRPETAATSVTVSRALLRLCQRGLVERMSGSVKSVGRAFRYVRR